MKVKPSCSSGVMVHESPSVLFFFLILRVCSRWTLFVVVSVLLFGPAICFIFWFKIFSIFCSLFVIIQIHYYIEYSSLFTTASYQWLLMACSMTECTLYINTIRADILLIITGNTCREIFLFLSWFVLYLLLTNQSMYRQW